MILRKLILFTSLGIISGFTNVALAFDEPTTQTNLPAWSTGFQSVSSEHGSFTSVNFGKGWLNDKWSSKGSLYQSNSEQLGFDNTRHWSMDITRRLLSANENTYIAMGLGWDDITLAEGDSTFGMRFVAEGRVGVYGPAYLFGQAALSPWMRDLDGYNNPLGKELELGLAVEPLPLMSLRAGYRSYWLNSENSLDESIMQRQTDGFFIGGGVNW